MRRIERGIKYGIDEENREGNKIRNRGEYGEK
jgi:hypothetical protein